MTSHGGRDDISAAFDTLKSACIKAKAKKAISENIDKLSIAVSLLTSPPSPFPFDKLEALLRLPLVLLYKQQAELALALAANVATLVFQKKFKSLLKASKPSELVEYGGWEKVMCSLLSGVLDFLEDNKEGKSRTLVGSLFMKTICDYFFPKSPVDLSHIAVDLRCTAYMLLSDLAVQHNSNQRQMREAGTLGGVRLGKVIADSKDYAVLEALLNLLARLLPSSSDPSKQLSFIKAVFLNSGRFTACGQDIVGLLQKEAIKDWEITSTKIIEVMAKSDISMPQPFDVDAVVVCGVEYPQTEVSDKFFIDRTSFFVNVKQDDGMYESLQVYFNTVSAIEIGGGKETVGVHVVLKTAPTLAEKLILPHGDAQMVLTTKILCSEHTRFVNTLRHRSLTPLMVGTRTPHHNPRVSVTQSSAVLDHDNVVEADAKLSLTKFDSVKEFYDAVSVRSEAPEPDNFLNHADTEANVVPSDIGADMLELPQFPTEGTRSRADVIGDSAMSTEIDVSDSKALAQDDGTPIPQNTEHSAQFDAGNAYSEKKILLSIEYDSDRSTPKGSNVVEADIANKRAKTRETTLARPTRRGKTMAIPDEEKDDSTTKRAIKIDTSSGKKDVETKGVSSKMKKKGERVTGTSSTRTTRAAAAAAKTKDTSVDHSDNNEKDRAAVTPAPVEDGVPVEAQESGKQDNIDTDFSEDELPKPSIRRKRKARGIVSDDDDDDKEKEPLVPMKKLRSEHNRSVKSTYTHGRAREKVKKLRYTSPLTALEGDVDYDNPPSEVGAKNTRKVGLEQRHPNRTGTAAVSRGHVAKHTKEAGKENVVEKVKKDMESLSGPKTTTINREPLQEVATQMQKSGSVVKQVPIVHKGLDFDIILINEVGDDDVTLQSPVKGGFGRISTSMNQDIPAPNLNPNPLLQKVLDSERERAPANRPSTEGNTGQRFGAREKPDPVIDLTSDADNSPKVKIEPRAKFNPSLSVHAPIGVGGDSLLQRLPAAACKVQEEEPDFIDQHKVTFDETLRFKSASFEQLHKAELKRPLPRGAVSKEGNRIGRSARAKTPEMDNLRRSREDTSYSTPRYDEHTLKEPGMKDFVDVLNAIQYVSGRGAVVENIANKSRTVRGDVRIARTKLLQDTVQDLDEMREESIAHLENLLSIESAYASVGRKVAAAYDDAVKDLQQGRSFLQQTVSTHDRGSLSKTMPQSLFSASLPTVFKRHAWGNQRNN